MRVMAARDAGRIVFVTLGRSHLAASPPSRATGGGRRARRHFAMRDASAQRAGSINRRPRRPIAATNKVTALGAVVTAGSLIISRRCSQSSRADIRPASKYRRPH